MAKPELKIFPTLQKIADELRSYANPFYAMLEVLKAEFDVFATPTDDTTREFASPADLSAADTSSSAPPRHFDVDVAKRKHVPKLSTHGSPHLTPGSQEHANATQRAQTFHSIFHAGP